MKLTQKKSLNNSKNIHEHDEYVKIIGKKFNDKILITGKYKGYKENIDASCKIHGPIINKKAGDLKRSKYACSICAKEEKIKATSDDYEIVIAKASTIHDNSYSYKNAKISKMVITNIYCVKHNLLFNQTKKSHLQGHTACPICKLNKQKNRNTTNLKKEVIDKSTFINKSNEIHNNKYDYKYVDYISMFNKVDIYCTKCNQTFPQTPNDHIHKKNGCPSCANIINAKKLRLSKDDFIMRAADIHGDKYNYDLTKFIDTKTKIDVFCKKHNETFLITPGKLLEGQGCSKCGKDKIKLEVEDVIEESKKIHGDKYNYDNSKLSYVKTKTFFNFFCKSCEVDVSQRVDEHLKGTKCKYCAGDIKDDLMFIKKATKIHDKRYSYLKTVYKNHKEKIIITCKEHGDFKQTPKVHLGGSGCPKCNMSKGEIEISRYLKLNNISYIHNKTYSEYCNTKETDKKLRFDFFLPEFKLFIEYDGKQHTVAENFGSMKVSKENRFENEQKRDIRKNQIVKDNKDFKLLRIDYKDFENIEVILNNELHI